ncbi:TetR/AcrR family transcriptional regulator [Sorangium sp. So ce1014]|uniref:TetR/AcrR family transcriptional regulator n=1 Tax=Sorangium sp. So ce1014 TaxID=3133326 RepID=UPI003F635033
MEHGHPGSASERRQRILEATERLLRRYGPAKTTVADIAREAEIAVGAVYLEFASKDAIVEELSQGQHRAVMAAMRAAAAGDDLPFCDRLRAVFDTRARSFLELAGSGAHACDLVHCQSRAVKAAHARFLDEERALLRDLIARGARAGELDVEDPELAARALLRVYASFSPPWLFQSSREEVEAMLSAVHRIVLYGLAGREPARKPKC